MNCLEQYTENYKFSYRNTILQKLSVERLIRRTIIVFPPVLQTRSNTVAAPRNTQKRFAFPSKTSEHLSLGFSFFSVRFGFSLFRFCSVHSVWFPHQKNVLTKNLWFPRQKMYHHLA